MQKTHSLAKRIIVFYLAVILIFPFSSTQTAEASLKKDIELSEQLTTAVILLQDVMQQQYKKRVSEVENLVQDNGYDYSITMESFMDKGNPFKDMDYIEFIATVSAVNSYLKKNGKKKISIMDTSFVTWTYETDSFDEDKPFKVDEYTQTPDGYYTKTGYHFTDKPENVGIYEEVDNPGIYKKIGEMRKSPEHRTVTYAMIDMVTLDSKGFIRKAGLDPSALEEDIERRKDILLGENDNDSLRSNVFIRLPDRFLTEDEWNELFLEAVGYGERSPIRMDGETIARIAATLIGQIPYEWGGKADKPGFDNTWWTFDEKNNLQKGLDCSGFVQWVYKTAGFEPEITNQMISTTTILNSNFKRVTEDELLPGDIGVVQHTSTNHCGIYAGNGEWYHSSSYNDTVVKAPYHFTTFYRPIDESLNLTRKVNISGEDAEEYSDDSATVSDGTENVSEESAGVDHIDPDNDKSVISAMGFAREGQEESKETIENKRTVELSPIIIKPDRKITVVAKKEANENDVMLLAKLISHEANNQGLNGWIAVGEVVKNRVESPLFPSNVQDVIFQAGQFTNAKSIYSITPRAEIINVARAVLSSNYGVINNKNVLYFRNAHGNTGNWGRHQIYAVVGQHSFYLQ